MRFLLLFLVKIYWMLKAKNQEPRCIFRISCSRHVYQMAKTEGLFKGLKAFAYRYQNCRDGYQVIINPVTDQNYMILPNGDQLQQHEIAKKFQSRLLNKTEF